MSCRNHLAAREPAVGDEGVDVEPGEQRQKEEQPADTSGEGAGREGERSCVGDRVGGGRGPMRALVIGPARQTGEALVTQHLLDGRRAETLFSSALQLVTDVVDGEVAFAKRAVTGVSGRAGARKLTEDFLSVFPTHTRKGRNRACPHCTPRSAT